MAHPAGSAVGSTKLSSVRLERMLLLLQPDAAQQKGLAKLLTDQQTRGNASFHKWLTPVQFADRYALSAGDAAQVAAWLRAQGFDLAALPASRGWIEFSGSLVQVQKAFGTTLKAVDSGSGEVRYQLAGAANFPASISGLVAGLVSLDGVLSAPAVTVTTELSGSAETLAAATSLNTAHALTPSLAAKWLNLGSLPAKGATGAGESIAIPVRSNVRQEDFAAFRRSFGLPEATLGVTLGGVDPGRTSDEAAAVLAASWAGVTAPDAQIVLVPAASTNATDGVDLALAAVVDGAMAHTVSLGYTACENSLSPAHQTFYAALYAQAAAEGMAIVAASGDSGAAGCHSPLDASPVANGWGVNGLASTPWNTAVGAVAFTADGTGLTGWQPARAADPAYATGGGFSSIYTTPQWQSAAGLPASDPMPANALGSVAAHHRYLPDVSLPTVFHAGNGSGIQGLAFCFAGDANSSGADGCHLVSAGGSAVSAALFSGIAAVLAQKYGPEGNLAPNLYALGRVRQDSSGSSQSSSESQSAFVDVTVGGAKLRCVPGSVGCTTLSDDTGEIGFDSAAGFDLASGLGSVNAGVLVANWTTPDATGTAPVTVEMTNTGGVTYNPSAIIALSARVLSGSGGTVPTGTVQFYDKSVSANTGTPVTLDSSGNATYSENGQFTVGGHNIAAIYSGDSTYESAQSQPVTINIQPSPTSLVVAPSTTTPSGGSTITVTGTVTATNPGNSPPTGTLTVNLDGLPQGNVKLATSGPTTSGSVNVVVPSAGAHTVQGIYSGDVNYNNATSPSVTITVAKGATVTSISAAPSTLTAGVLETFTATMAPATTTTTAFTITGTVSFYDGGTTLLGTATISSNTAILTGIVLSTTSAHTITAVYSGDANWSASVSSPLLLQPILMPVTVTLAASNSVLAPGQSVTLTATVTPVNLPVSTAEQHPTGNVYFYAGTTLIGETSVTAGLGDTAVATVFVPSLPAGAYVITAQYTGDGTYGTAVSNSLNLAIEDFTIGCSVNSVTVVQGQTATVTCSVASLGGLTGPIQIVCAEQNPPQNGAINCTFDPTVINGTGRTTLTIATAAGNISQASLKANPDAKSSRGQRDRHGPPLWQAAGGGVVLAFAGLLLSPIGRRARWLRRGGARMLGLALLMIGLAGTGLGCNNSVTLANNGGTPLGVSTLKITAGADVNTVTVSHYAYLTVNVTP
ncbi:Ig-like domain repeat protein [Acidicapsa acidisoli]|uniref:Ig-like domain repeat protein n=1 Tax=Acidicapsa acidisoli TaxID=1615681 RepID=UPI0021E0D290|nr:Ig-like domain repeat protein [Acidicapsa acidisoli]